MTTGTDTDTAIGAEGFGALADGSPVRRWTLERDGVRVRVLTYGAIVQSVEVPGRDGSPAPVALGLPDVAGYEEFPAPYFGAVVGRYANRIGGASFVLDILVAPEPDPIDGLLLRMTSLCGRWLSMNVLMVDERRVIAERHHTGMLRALERWGFEPIPGDLMHYAPFGGSFHCATLDVRRRGTLESYFD